MHAQEENLKEVLLDQEQKNEEQSTPIDEKKAAAGKESDSGDKSQNLKIRTKDIGIWRVFFEETPWAFMPGANIAQRAKDTINALPYMWMFMREIWVLTPGYLILWSFLIVWRSLTTALGLFVTARMMQTMQSIIISGEPNLNAVWTALGLKILHGTLSWIFGALGHKCGKALKRRINSYCGERLLASFVHMDLVTLQRKDIQSKMKKTSQTLFGDQIWENFEDFIERSTSLLEIASQGWFLSSFFRTQENGLALAVVCVLPQIITGLLHSSSLNGVWFALVVDKAYIRLRSVGDMALSKSYYEEVISSGLGRYIQSEYIRASEKLGPTSHSNIYRMLWDENTLWRLFVEIATEDASLVYYLIAVAFNPSSFSLSSLTVMRESANAFAWTIWRLFSNDSSLVEKILFIQDYYALLEVKNEIQDGLTLYPAPDAQENSGMKIEFRDVSFKYPHSDNYALKNVSFTINPGSTIILVGQNGSGKTSTVSLLSRLFDATSGEILIDDRPISSFQAESLRDAQAILRQSYQHFPFSLRENIGIGDPMWLQQAGDSASDAIANERILRAAKMGGADEIIEEIGGLHDKKRTGLKKLDKLASKKSSKDATEAANGGVYSTVLDDENISEGRPGWDVNVNPVSTWTGSWHLRGTKLGDIADEVEKNLELSGGQWQRLSLARLFMRAERPQVRLVCTDEPSAALDPRAEYDVFKRLQELHGRKATKIFITHRFGHLTKHADLVLCLKKGELVEVGTHEELMMAQGEYASLYEIQAQAFKTT